MESVEVDDGNIQNVLRGCICSKIRMVEGGDSMIMSFIYYGSRQANRGILGEKPAGMGSYGTIKMIFLYLIILYTHYLASWLVEDERMKFLAMPSL